jgi:hypothetical protein
LSNPKDKGKSAGGKKPPGVPGYTIVVTPKGPWPLLLQPRPSQRRQTKTMTPQERFAARVKQLRAGRVKGAVEQAADEFNISTRVAYRWWAEGH